MCRIGFIFSIVFCVGCAGLSYRNGDQSIAIIKFGIDTKLQAGSFQSKSETESTDFKVEGYEDAAKLELLRTAIELAK